MDTTKSVTLSLTFSQTLVLIMDSLVFLYWRSFVPSGFFLLSVSRLKRRLLALGMTQTHQSSEHLPTARFKFCSQFLLLWPVGLFSLIFLVSCVCNVVCVWCMYICVCPGACAHCIRLSRPEDDPGCLPLSLPTYF